MIASAMPAKVLRSPPQDRRSVRVLLLEDDADDAELIAAAIAAAPFQVDVATVATRDAFVAALSPNIDVILADHSLPGYDAVSALRAVKERGLDIPFIIVSGAISEQRAIETMREGAADYLLKDRMARLLPAVTQALDDHDLRRAIEKERATHRKELEALVENSPDAIMRFDRSGRHLYVNAATERFTGLRRDEVLGRTGEDLPFPEYSKSLWRRGVAQVRETGEAASFEYEFETPFGRRCFEVRLIPEVDGCGSFDTILAIARDITKRKIDEQRLEESEQRWRSLVDYHPDALTVVVGEKIAYANAATARMYGVDAPGDLIGRSIRDFISADQFDEVDARMKRLASGERTEPVEYRMFRMDGEERDVEVYSIPITYAGRSAVQSVLHDVTEQREYENKLIEAREQAEEIARLKSSILTNLGHEMRTPLSTLLGFTDILREHVDREGLDLLELLQDSADRLAVTLSSVLDLARLEAGKYELHIARTNLVGEVGAAVEALRARAAHRRVELHWAPPETSVNVLVDPSIVRRVTELLLDNAIKFSEAGGLVEIELGADADHVCVAVRDSGIGISAEFLPRLFDAFEQESKGLSRDYEGCGIGLAIVKRMLELAGGSVTVDSARGAGSRFEVHFPCRPPCDDPS